MTGVKTYVSAEIVSLIAKELGLDRQTMAKLFGINPSEADKWTTYGVRNRNKEEDFKNLVLLYRMATKGDGIFTVKDLKDMIAIIVKYPWLAKDKTASLGLHLTGCPGLMALAAITLFARARGIDMKWDCGIEEDFEEMRDELYGRS